MKFSIGLLLSFCILVSCNSQMGKYEKKVQSFISSADSTRFLLNNQIDSIELEELITNAAITWNQAKSVLINDTLDPSSLTTLDAFNTAFSNSKSLLNEYRKCNAANNELKIRLAELLIDIQEQNGDRSTFCSSIQYEKEELTIIRNHAIDIHRRFEELKSSKAQFESTFSR